MRKIKIRKVEATPEEILNRIDELLIVDETMSYPYFGTSMKRLCKFLGLKDLELWEFRIQNKKEFDSKFYIYEMQGKPIEKYFLRMVIVDKLDRKPPRV